MSEAGWRVAAILIFVTGAVVLRVLAGPEANTLAGALAGSAATIMFTTRANGK